MFDVYSSIPINCVFTVDSIMSDPDTSTKDMNDSEQRLGEILRMVRTLILQRYISKERISAVIKNQKKDNRQQHGIGYCKSCCLLEILEGMLGDNLGLDDKS